MVMGNYLWKEDKDLDSRGTRLTGPHRSNKHTRHARGRRPLDVDASWSTSEVPETPQGYHHLTLPRRHSRQRSIHRAGSFPLVVPPAICHSPPCTPTRRSRPLLQHEMSVNQVAPSVHSKTETEPPSPLAIGPSKPHQVRATIVAPNSDESVTEPEPETD